MGPFKKYATCVMALFTPFNFVTFCQFTLSLPLCYLLNFTKKSQNERKDFFAFMAASPHHAISKEIENHIFRHK